VLIPHRARRLHMVRHGQLIGLQPGKLAEYAPLPRESLAEILSKITECNIHNYSISTRTASSRLFRVRGIGLRRRYEEMADTRKRRNVGDHEAPAENRSPREPRRSGGPSAGSLSPGLIGGRPCNERECIGKACPNGCGAAPSGGGQGSGERLFLGQLLERWRRRAGPAAGTDIYRYYDLD